MQTPVFVDGSTSFEEMVQHLNQQKAIGVDTESNSLHAYQERVCLIQISSVERDFLLDPFAFEQMEALGAVFANPGIQKIFHAGDYDLSTLKRDYGYAFQNLFDTMIAASAIGETNLGLGGLVETYLGVTLEKQYQRADWGKRPIRPEMLVYAQADSHYLIALRDQLIPLLQQKQRLQLVLEDSAALASQTPAMKKHMEDLWRVNGINGMKPKALSLLKQLNHLREELAQAQDVPPFKILGDRALVEIAQNHPKYIQELDLLPSLSRGQVRRYGKDIIRAIRAWSKAPDKVERKRYQRMDDKIIRRRELLGEWRKELAKAKGVSSSVILPKDLLENIAEQPINDRNSLKQAMRTSPSRFSQYGEEIWSVLRKEDE